jgi:conjugal transfer pilus assembly protein TraD
VTRRGGPRRVLWLMVGLGVLIAPAPWGPAFLAVLIAGRIAKVVLTHSRPRFTRPPPGAAHLGHDVRGRPVALSDEQLGAHALIVGASGAGKSTTLQTILADRIARGHPVVAIDMKGSPSFARALAVSSHAAGRSLRVWTPEGPTHWNPLAHGGPTALKDRLISAERFSEPHYQRAAERYLQTALQVLAAHEPGRPPHLSEVVALMEPGRLRALARTAPEPLAQRVEGYLEALTPDQLSAARGLGTRLALLSESDAGRWLQPSAVSGAGGAGGPTLDLGDALLGGDVVLLSINSSIYGALGAQLGALAIADLTSAAGRRLAGDAALPDPSAAPVPTARPSGPATVALDEFSALGADNLLSLLARGRESGVGVLLATQELADLERAGRGFRDQVLGITAVTLAHRQEVHESALAISRMAGTRRVWRETQTIPSYPALSDAPASRGSRRQQEEPVVHPNTIKRLSTGRVVLLSGVPRPTVAEGRVDARTPGVRPRPPGIRSRVPGIRSRPAGIRSRVPGIRSRARTGDGRGR